MADVSLRPSAIARHWASQASALRASGAALSISLLATLVAGAVLAGARDTLTDTPGLLVLIPAAIGMRGSNFGALAARLGTGTLTGEFDGSLAPGSFLWRQAEASIRLAVGGAASAGGIAWIAARTLGIETIPLLELVAISLVGAVVAASALLLVTVALAVRAHSANWSMDDVGAPIITAVGDVVSLPALLLATTLVSPGTTATVIGLSAFVLGALAVGTGAWSRSDLVRRVIRESAPVLAIAVSVDTVAGIVMEARLDSLLEEPALLVLIPPFVASSGALGGMLASRLASLLHVGMLAPRPIPSPDAWLQMSMTGLLASITFGAVGAVGWVAAVLGGLDPPSLLGLGTTSLVGGVLATVALSGVAYLAATASYRFGLDPDNHSIPIVTASMDLLGILCLVAAVGLTGG
ncbi:MAG: magnesium transporter [Nitriliruptorales bacterium]|nr:magnesium transporter [Nitriliruptorales bacterium]